MEVSAQEVPKFEPRNSVGCYVHLRTISFSNIQVQLIQILKNFNDFCVGKFSQDLQAIFLYFGILWRLQEADSFGDVYELKYRFQLIYVYKGEI